MKKNKIIKILSIALLGSTIFTTGINTIEAHAAWKQNSTGWWFTEGNSWVTGWKQISGVWYFFDSNGYMKVGWVNDNGTWYYMNKSGAMQTGWVNDCGTWYYMNKSGAMQTGWVNDNGTWYYLEKSGAMKTGWLSYNGKWYFLKSNGAMASDEYITDKGKEYYLYRNGIMRTGWAPHGDYTCFLDYNTGEVVKGWREIDGKTYYFNEIGKSLNGIIERDGKEYLLGLDDYVIKNYTSSFITTDANGMVTNYNIDLAKEYILKNDSEYINEQEKTFGELNLIDPKVVFKYSSYSVYEESLDDYGIDSKEAFIELVLFGSPSDDIMPGRGFYLVGAETGKVYCIGEKPGLAIYEIKDGKIVNTFKKADSVDWR